MKTSVRTSLLIAILSLASVSASAATFAFKKPMTNPNAADSSRCVQNCDAVARVMLDIQQAKAGTGASTPGGTGDAGAQAAADRAQAQSLVAYLNWTAKREAWGLAVNAVTCSDNSPEVATACDRIEAIGVLDSDMFGRRVVNLRVSITGDPGRPAVCAAAATLGATCVNGLIVATFNAGSPVHSETPDTLADTANLLDPGQAP